MAMLPMLHVAKTFGMDCSRSCLRCLHHALVYGNVLVTSRPVLLVCVLLSLILLALVKLQTMQGQTILVLPSGMPILTQNQSYPDLLTQDITGQIPQALEQQVLIRFKLLDNIKKQASPLKLLSIPRRQPSCPALIKGDEKEVSHALHFMEQHKTPRIPNSLYTNAPSDCQEFIKSRGYITYTSEEERQFPLAFGIMMYCDVEHTERLLRSIYRPHNHYCIHVDAKASQDIKDAMKGIVQCLPNVYFASSQNVVDWSAYNSLIPWITCMEDLLKFQSWKYFINLTGQEFPLKTNLQLVKILRSMKGTNIVDATVAGHYSGRWFEAFPAPHGIQPYKGMVFVLVSRGFVNYTIHSQPAKDFLKWVTFTNYPDETFFPSLNHNPHLGVPGSYTGHPDTNAIRKPFIGRFVNWGSGWLDEQARYPFSWPCGGKRVRGVCIFGIRDLPILINRKELFVNKLHLNFEHLTLDCLEEWHLNMTVFEYAKQLDYNTSWYSELDTVKNRIVQ